jgi:hypothetical protein
LTKSFQLTWPYHGLATKGLKFSSIYIIQDRDAQEALISITPEKVLGANILVRVFWPLWERRHVLPVLPMLVPEVVGVDTTEEEEWGDTAVAIVKHLAMVEVAPAGKDEEHTYYNDSFFHNSKVSSLALRPQQPAGLLLQSFWGSNIPLLSPACFFIASRSVINAFALALAMTRSVLVEDVVLAKRRCNPVLARNKIRTDIFIW